MVDDDDDDSVVPLADESIGFEFARADSSFYKSSASSLRSELLARFAMKANAGAAALVAELNRALELFKQLNSHLHDLDLDLCRALAPRTMSAIENSIRIASDRPTSSSHFQRPRSEAPKRRKSLHSWKSKVRLSSVAGGVEGTGHDDGYTWRKYGQKEILGAKYPRAYFRCTHSASHGCPAKKQVQRPDDDLLVVDITYHEHHTCPPQRSEQGSGRHAMHDSQERQSMALRLEAEEFVPPTVPSLCSSSMDDEIASLAPLDDYCFSTSPYQIGSFDGVGTSTLALELDWDLEIDPWLLDQNWYMQ